MADEEVIPQQEEQEVETEEGAEGTETTQAEEPEEEELDEKSLRDAKAIYKLLKNPNTQEQVIRLMASNAGILPRDGVRPPETKAEIKEAKKDIKDLIKDKLGKDFEFFAPKLAEAIEAVLEEERANYRSDVKELTQANIQSQVDSALSRLNKETNGASKALEHKIAALVDEYPQPKGKSVYDYLKEMYQLAGGKPTGSPKKIADKIQQNAKDATSRLRTSGGQTGKTPQSAAAPEKKGLRAAVEFAAKAMEK